MRGKNAPSRADVKSHLETQTLSHPSTSGIPCRRDPCPTTCGKPNPPLSSTSDLSSHRNPCPTTSDLVQTLTQDPNCRPNKVDFQIPPESNRFGPNPITRSYLFSDRSNPLQLFPFPIDACNRLSREERWLFLMEAFFKTQKCHIYRRLPTAASHHRGARRGSRPELSSMFFPLPGSSRAPMMRRGGRCWLLPIKIGDRGDSVLSISLAEGVKARSSPLAVSKDGCKGWCVHPGLASERCCLVTPRCRKGGAIRWSMRPSYLMARTRPRIRILYDGPVSVPNQPSVLSYILEFQGSGELNGRSPSSSNSPKGYTTHKGNTAQRKTNFAKNSVPASVMGKILDDQTMDSTKTTLSNFSFPFHPLRYQSPFCFCWLFVVSGNCYHLVKGRFFLPNSFFSLMNFSGRSFRGVVSSTEGPPSGSSTKTPKGYTTHKGNTTQRQTNTANFSVPASDKGKKLEEQALELQLLNDEAETEIRKANTLMGCVIGEEISIEMIREKLFSEWRLIHGEVQLYEHSHGLMIRLFIILFLSIKAIILWKEDFLWVDILVPKEMGFFYVLVHDSVSLCCIMFGTWHMKSNNQILFLIFRLHMALFVLWNLNLSNIIPLMYLSYYVCMVILILKCWFNLYGNLTKLVLLASLLVSKEIGWQLDNGAIRNFLAAFLFNVKGSENRVACNLFLFSSLNWTRQSLANRILRIGLLPFGYSSLGNTIPSLCFQGNACIKTDTIWCILRLEKRKKHIIIILINVKHNFSMVLLGRRSTSNFNRIGFIGLHIERTFLISGLSVLRGNFFKTSDFGSVQILITGGGIYVSIMLFDVWENLELLETSRSFLSQLLLGSKCADTIKWLVLFVKSGDKLRLKEEYNTGTFKRNLETRDPGVLCILCDKDRFVCRSLFVIFA